MLRIARSNPTSPRKRGEVKRTRAPVGLNVIMLSIAHRLMVGKLRGRLS
jgi:hypothetical protein